MSNCKITTQMLTDAKSVTSKRQGRIVALSSAIVWFDLCIVSSILSPESFRFLGNNGVHGLARMNSGPHGDDDGLSYQEPVSTSIHPFGSLFSEDLTVLSFFQ